MTQPRMFHQITYDASSLESRLKELLSNLQAYVRELKDNQGKNEHISDLLVYDSFCLSLQRRAPEHHKACTGVPHHLPVDEFCHAFAAAVVPPSIFSQMFGYASEDTQVLEDCLSRIKRLRRDKPIIEHVAKPQMPSFRLTESGPDLLKFLERHGRHAMDESQQNRGIESVIEDWNSVSMDCDQGLIDAYLLSIHEIGQFEHAYQNDKPLGKTDTQRFLAGVLEKIATEEMEGIVDTIFTQEVFEHPVTIWKDGGTYERDGIMEWLRKKGTSPLTRAHITAENPVVPDQTMKKIATQWVDARKQLLGRSEWRGARPEYHARPTTASHASRHSLRSRHEEQASDVEQFMDDYRDEMRRGRG